MTAELIKNRFIIVPILLVTFLFTALCLFCFLNFGTIVHSEHGGCFGSSMNTTCSFFGHEQHGLSFNAMMNKVGDALVLLMLFVFLIFSTKQFALNSFFIKQYCGPPSVGYSEAVRYKSFQWLYYWIALKNNYREGVHHGCILA